METHSKYLKWAYFNEKWNGMEIQEQELEKSWPHRDLGFLDLRQFSTRMVLDTHGSLIFGGTLVLFLPTN